MIVGFDRRNWPSPQFWSDLLVVGCIILTGAIPVIQTTITELGAKRAAERLTQEDNVRSSLASCLVVIVRECDAPWDQVGIQAFVVVTGWRWWRQRQERLAKIRLSTIPSSGVTWEKGKGVIGMCWETRNTQWAQLDEPPFANLENEPEHRWAMLDRRRTYGLSFNDYRALGRNYGTVAAVPIMSGDSYIGCITLDTPSGVKLERSEVAVQQLYATADVVRRLLKR